MPGLSSTTAAGLARRVTPGQWQAVETGLAAVTGRMLALLPAPRVAALGHVYSAVALNLCRLDAYWNDTPLNRRRTSHPARPDLTAQGTGLATSINGGPRCRHDHRLK